MSCAARGFDDTPGRDLPGATDWWWVNFVPLKSRGVSFDDGRENHEQETLIIGTMKYATAIYQQGGADCGFQGAVVLPAMAIRRQPSRCPRARPE